MQSMMRTITINFFIPLRSWCLGQHPHAHQGLTARAHGPSTRRSHRPWYYPPYMLSIRCAAATNIASSPRSVCAPPSQWPPSFPAKWGGGPDLKVVWASTRGVKTHTINSLGHGRKILRVFWHRPRPPVVHYFWLFFDNFSCMHRDV